MKRSLSVILFLLFSFQLLYSQVTDSTTIQSQQNEYDFYLLKSKKQKTGGTVLLVSGLVMEAAGLVIMVSKTFDYLGGQKSGLIAGAGLAIFGAAAVITSIPILISSGSNKRKARAFITTGDFRDPIKNSRYASIGISFDF
jgi:hypothetical protein